jgi:hypothetical protein
MADNLTKLYNALRATVLTNTFLPTTLPEQQRLYAILEWLADELLSRVQAPGGETAGETAQRVTRELDLIWPTNNTGTTDNEGEPTSTSNTEDRLTNSPPDTASPFKLAQSSRKPVTLGSSPAPTPVKRERPVDTRFTAEEQARADDVPSSSATA